MNDMFWVKRRLRLALAGRKHVLAPRGGAQAFCRHPSDEYGTFAYIGFGIGQWYAMAQQTFFADVMFVAVAITAMFVVVLKTLHWKYKSMSLEQLPTINFQREFVKHNDRATQSNNFLFF